MANFKELSRYSNFTSEKNRAGKLFIVKRNAINFPEGDDDVYVTINKELIGRPDLISFKAYGTPDLWWAILDFNNIKDPLFEIKIGQIIKIPSLDTVLSFLE